MFTIEAIAELVRVLSAVVVYNWPTGHLSSVPSVQYVCFTSSEIIGSGNCP
jgi:hypothetical protein